MLKRKETINPAVIASTNAIHLIQETVKSSKTFSGEQGTGKQKLIEPLARRFTNFMSNMTNKQEEI